MRSEKPAYDRICQIEDNNHFKEEGLMKVAVIGGGSSYTPEIINGFIDRMNTFPIDELWLMDASPERLETVGKFAQRMVQAKGSPFEVCLTRDQKAAVEGAAYVITQLRVGMMDARRNDEYLGRRHGLVGQETTGVGGMAKALRTIPVILKIAEDIRSLAPGALLINFTNPAGLVTQAISKYAPDVAVVGVCNNPITTKMRLLSAYTEKTGLQADPEEAELDGLGLNHLSWYRSLKVNGIEIWPELMQGIIEEAKNSDLPDFDPRTLEVLGMLPNGYLQYYYYTERKIEDQKNWPPSRAEQVMTIEQDLFNQYSDPDRTEAPEGLMKRGGAYYSTVATQLLNSHFNNLGETHTVNVRNDGAVPGWPDDWVLEIPASVGRSGIKPLPTRPLPLECSALVETVKAYELLTADAAILGDRDAAYKALLVHPLGPPADKVQAVLDDLLETNRNYLPAFWKE
jgi:6-phospho-beta-glucosidase